MEKSWEMTPEEIRATEREDGSQERAPLWEIAFQLAKHVEQQAEALRIQAAALKKLEEPSGRRFRVSRRRESLLPHYWSGSSAGVKCQFCGELFENAAVSPFCEGCRPDLPANPNPPEPEPQRFHIWIDTPAGPTCKTCGMQKWNSGPGHAPYCAGPPDPGRRLPATPHCPPGAHKFDGAVIRGNPCTQCGWTIEQLAAIPRQAPIFSTEENPKS